MKHFIIFIIAFLISSNLYKNENKYLSDFFLNQPKYIAKYSNNLNSFKIIK